jgi:hypothetical protein
MYQRQIAALEPAGNKNDPRQVGIRKIAVDKLAIFISALSAGNGISGYFDKGFVFDYFRDHGAK